MNNGARAVQRTYLTLTLLNTLATSLIFAAEMPIRQTYLNGVIPSKQRATVLSFDSMIGSGGGVIFQPALGRVADVYSYSASYMVSGVISAFAIPFMLLARKEKAKSDTIKKDGEKPEVEVVEELKK